MQSLDDTQLLSAYVTQRSEAAFALLVERHVGLVHASALRQVRDPHLAQDVTQAVFIILARKAASLRRETVLAGWLCRTAHLTARNALKAEYRRQHRESEAYMESQMPTAAAEAWPHVAPLLDEAVAQLGETDRNAVVLRFYQQKPMAEVGAALGLSEDTAQKRVTRALEKLRKFFTKRGVTLSAAALATAVSAHSVSAAPAGMAATISTVAATPGATAAGSTATLVKGALKLMAWTQVKLAIAVAVGVLLAAGTTTMAVKSVEDYFGPDRYLASLSNETFPQIPPYLLIRPTHFHRVAEAAARQNRPFVNAIGNPNRAIGRDSDMEALLEYAYDYHQVAYRVILPAEKLSDAHYDFIATVPNALEQLRAEIKRQFGYAARREMVNTNVLVLKVRNPSAPGLHESAVNQPLSQNTGRFVDWHNGRLADLATRLETFEEIPVIDQTGLAAKNGYDIQLDWQPDNTPAAKAALRQAVLDQLGLELVETNLPIEMLVIEKVK